ncbi:cytochrome c biogenesis protein ResB [soil metagenome]
MIESTATNVHEDRSIIDIVVDRIWRFFCSTRAAIVEIAIVALFVLIGTLRQSEVPHWIGRNIPGTVWLVKRWLDWDVFHSFVFMMSLAILCVAIFIGGMINRISGIWNTIRNPTVRTTHGYLNGADPSAFVRSTSNTEELATTITGALKKKRYRIRQEQVGDEVHVYADRNAYGILGTFPFHIALILILVGGIVGAHWGFREQNFIIPEGSVRAVGHGTDLSVGLTQFTDTYTEEGQPHNYQSDLVIYKDGEEVKSGSITVNHPISYDNATFYQASFGQAVQLKVTDANGNVLFDDSVALGEYQVKMNPDAPAAIIDLLPLNMELVVIAPDENPANRPDLDNLNLRSGEMWIQIRPKTAVDNSMPEFSTVTQGQPQVIAGLNVEFVRERRFTLLQVGYNPGIDIFFVGSIMLVGGLLVVFYFPHRRMRAIISSTPLGSIAHLAPMAKRDWSGQRDFESLMERLKTEFGFDIETKSGKNASARDTLSDRNEAVAASST